MYFKVYSLLFNYIRIDCFVCLFVFCVFFDSTFFLSHLTGHIYNLLSIYFRLTCACALITFLMGSPHGISSSQRITNFSNISFAEDAGKDIPVSSHSVQCVSLMKHSCAVSVVCESMIYRRVIQGLCV